MTPTARLALVGDRSPSIRAHVRIPGLVEALRQRDGLALDTYWIPSDDIVGIEQFDGIWVVPGSPYSDQAGVTEAIRIARENGIPFLGTCGGFQHALLEFARNVCGLGTVGHAEYGSTSDNLIVELACSLVGHEGAIRISPGTLAERIFGARRTVERYHCSYGLDPRYLDVLSAAGLRFSGFDDSGEVRTAELPDHPFYFATLFQPELAGDGTVPHPVVRAFACAVVERAAKTFEASAQWVRVV